MWRKLRNFWQHFVRFSQYKAETTAELEDLRRRVYKLEQDALLRDGTIRHLVNDNRTLRRQYSELLHYVGDYRHLVLKYESRCNQG